MLRSPAIAVALVFLTLVSCSPSVDEGGAQSPDEAVLEYLAQYERVRQLDDDSVERVRQIAEQVRQEGASALRDQMHLIYAWRGQDSLIRSFDALQLWGIAGDDFDLQTVEFVDQKGEVVATATAETQRGRGEIVDGVGHIGMFVYISPTIFDDEVPPAVRQQEQDQIEAEGIAIADLSAAPEQLYIRIRSAAGTTSQSIPVRTLHVWRRIDPDAVKDDNVWILPLWFDG